MGQLVRTRCYLLPETFCRTNATAAKAIPSVRRLAGSGVVTGSSGGKGSMATKFELETNWVLPLLFGSESVRLRLRLRFEDWELTDPDSTLLPPEVKNRFVPAP